MNQVVPEEAGAGGCRGFVVDLLFALLIAFAAATRLRFAADALGPAELAGVLACLLVFLQRWRSGRGFWPGWNFLLAWGTFWICALLGCLTRQLLSEAVIAGFWHNLLAMLYLTGLTWFFWLEYSGVAPRKTASPDRAALSSGNASSLRRMRRVFALAAGLAAPLSILPYLLTICGISGSLFLFHTPQGERFCGLATNPNQMALLALLACCLSLYLLASGKGVLRCLWLPVALGQLGVLWGTHSDIGKGLVYLLPGLVLASWLLSLLRRWLPGWRPFAAMVCVLVLGGAFWLCYHGLPLAWRVQQELSTRMGSEREEGNLKYRLMLLENACTVVERSPVWGAGFGTHIEYDQIFPAAPSGREAHNTVIDVALAAGLMGLLVLGLVCARAVWNVWREGGWMLLAGLWTIFIFGSVHNYMRQPAVWLFILYCILWRSNRREYAAACKPLSNPIASRGTPPATSAATLAPAVTVDESANKG